MSFSSALLSGGTIQPWWFSVLDVVGVQKRPRRLRQEPQLLKVSENEAEEGRM